jgi:RHS repeat-associated protein
VDWEAVEAALAADPWQVADVLAPLSGLLETDPFTSSVSYDALNRPVSVTTPDYSVYRPRYNEANLLDRVDVNLHGATANGQPVWTPFVTNLNYNAKGQRVLIAYANGATTTYTYDPDTFRLTHLQTTRPPGNGLATQFFQHPDTVQHVQYTYDSAGNIIRIADEALLGVVNNNQPVDPVCSYHYDALYRLIEATGREHIGQTAHDFNPQNRRDYDFVGLADFLAHPNDLQALRNYTERYAYDAVGNFDVVRHSANGGSWTRHYDYEEDSLIEPGKLSNRLTRTAVGNGGNDIESYTYSDAQGNDVHGCMTAINNIAMIWNFADQLHQVELGGGGTAYYVYDAGGQRVRKVWEKAPNLIEERLYLGGFEVYRKYNGNGQTITLERETLHVMDDQQRIALVETKTRDNSVQINAPIPAQRFQCGNHLGSASLELDEHAQIITYEEYSPYGSTSYQAGRSAAEVSLKRYRYTGMERDEESGLAYHTARYYLPWLGRWVSADPIGIAGGVNLYCYCDDIPTVKIDYSGNNPEEDRGISEREIESAQHDHDFATILWHSKFVTDRPSANRNYKEGFVKQVRNNISGFAHTFLILSGYNEDGNWREMSKSYLKAADMYKNWFVTFYGPNTSFLKDTVLGYDPFETIAPQAYNGYQIPKLSHAEHIEYLEKEQAEYNYAVADNMSQGVLGSIGAAVGGEHQLEWSTMGVATGGMARATQSIATAPRSNLGATAPPPNPNIRPHGQQPDPRPPNMQSHHPEQQAALNRCVANYNPRADPALLIPTPQHQATFRFQAAQRSAGTAFERNLGSSDALGQAAVIMGLVGVNPATAGQVALEHSGYLFSLTPANQVGRYLPASSVPPRVP